ncbi:hypothetical protein ACXWR7_11865, partial [Streptococcus pyogenes]
MPRPLSSSSFFPLLSCFLFFSLPFFSSSLPPFSLPSSFFFLFSPSSFSPLLLSLLFFFLLPLPLFFFLFLPFPSP